MKLLFFWRIIFDLNLVDNPPALSERQWIFEISFSTNVNVFVS